MVSEKSPTTIGEKNVNLPTKHLFLPSGMFWWEISSRNEKRSYFIDSNAEFCTCKGYYFNFKKNNGCYHLVKILEYAKAGDYWYKEYADDDYPDFSKKIVMDVINEVQRSSYI